ncbi:MAG TPA: hypothetical protein VJL61_06740 [Rhodanobacteraceae bacterium]|nr:hypothetical protein [Rhodanobacteraceae bacterium]
MSDAPEEMVRVTHEEMAHAWMNTWAHVFALDFAVSTMIGLYPDKNRLIKVWDQSLPDHIDEWMSMPEYRDSGFRERLHGTLAHLRELLEDAAEADGQGDNGTD